MATPLRLIFCRLQDSLKVSDTSIVQCVLDIDILEYQFSALPFHSFTIAACNLDCETSYIPSHNTFFFKICLPGNCYGTPEFPGLGVYLFAVLTFLWFILEKIRQRSFSRSICLAVPALDSFARPLPEIFGSSAQPNDQEQPLNRT